MLSTIKWVHRLQFLGYKINSNSIQPLQTFLPFTYYKRVNQVKFSNKYRHLPTEWPITQATCQLLDTSFNWQEKSPTLMSKDSKMDERDLPLLDLVNTSSN